LIETAILIVEVLFSRGLGDNGKDRIAEEILKVSMY